MQEISKNCLAPLPRCMPYGKKPIASDSRKNNSVFAAAISAALKNRMITARMPRANTAETSGHNGAPCSAATKR